MTPSVSSCTRLHALAPLPAELAPPHALPAFALALLLSSPLQLHGTLRFQPYALELLLPELLFPPRELLFLLRIWLFLELKKFNELLALLPTHLQPLVSFLYYCGVRVNEARQIEWSQVDLDAHLIRLEEEQTKTEEARIIPLPSVLVMTLREMKPKKGLVFSDTNLRVEWETACAACGLGTRTKIEPKTDNGFAWYKYKGLLLHDLRRSAVRNLRIAGAMKASL